MMFIDPIFRPFICTLVIVAFTATMAPPLRAQELSLPQPGVRVGLSPAFNPPVLKGLASLTVPEQDLWVNLSPYEKDRIVPTSFGQTEMGRDLLAQDYLLKQITASLIYPEDEFGKAFWNRIYQEASQRYGTTNIPVNTFNKVWIVPEKAVVYENAQAGTAYVVESRLKVMLEEDYLALANNQTPTRGHVPQNVSPSTLPSDAGLNAKAPQGNPPNDVEAIYQQYLKAFKKGVYNYIKEEQDPVTQQMVPRKYFSGGFFGAGIDRAMTTTKDPKVMRRIFAGVTAGLIVLGVALTKFMKDEESPPIEIKPISAKDGLVQKAGPKSLEEMALEELEAEINALRKKALERLDEESLKAEIEAFIKARLAKMNPNNEYPLSYENMMRILGRLPSDVLYFLFRDLNEENWHRLVYASAETKEILLVHMLDLMEGKSSNPLTRSMTDNLLQTKFAGYRYEGAEKLIKDFMEGTKLPLEEFGSSVEYLIRTVYAVMAMSELQNVPSAFLWDYFRNIMQDQSGLKGWAGQDFIPASQGALAQYTAAQEIFRASGSSLQNSSLPETQAALKDLSGFYMAAVGVAAVGGDPDLQWRMAVADMFLQDHGGAAYFMSADESYRKELTQKVDELVRKMSDTAAGDPLKVPLNSLDRGQLRLRMQKPDRAMTTQEENKSRLKTGKTGDSSQLSKPSDKLGGIDLNRVDKDLQVKNQNGGIKFKIDPAMMEQLQNAPGFVPAIINIQPMTDLRLFLGVQETSGNSIGAV